VTGASLNDAWSTATKELNDYFGGGNKDGEKLGRTVPTVMRVKVEDSEARTIGQDFDVSYFLPYDMQARARRGGPPTPGAPAAAAPARLPRRGRPLCARWAGRASA